MTDKNNSKKSAGTMNFMLPVPEASVPAVDICWLRSAAGMILSASVTR